MQEKTDCLTRDSPLIVAHVGLRRMRKGLLGDLSSLVKTAKKLQEALQSNNSPAPVFGRLDELVLKAFKLVTRAVRFLDIWAQDAVSLSFDMGEGSNRPLTPPSDSADLAVEPPSTSNQNDADGARANEDPAAVSQANASATQELLDHEATQPRNPARLSVAFSIPSDSDALQSPLLSSQSQPQGKRLSVTHRLSYTGKSQGSRKQNLASERLSAAHDSFLGFLGSFLGLHLHSRSSEDLAVTTRESVVACRSLLAVVEEVWERDSRRSEQLEQARDTMYTRLTELVHATKDMFGSFDAGTGEEVIMPDQGKHLVAAATSCVRSAGDCVTKARVVIERIGDFEFESGEPRLSHSIFDQLNRSETSEEQPTETPQSDFPILPGRATEIEKPLPPPPTDERKLLPPLVISDSKPLPQVPRSPSTMNQNANLRPTQNNCMDGPAVVSVRTSMSSLSPSSAQHTAQHLSQPSPSDASQSPASATQRFFGKSIRTDSLNASVADTSSTYRNSVRGETGSISSQTSTRATTPDQSPIKKISAQTLTSSFGSSSELRSVASEDVVAAEEHLLETTYAHQLIYNTDGHISGGSLPALVEQLTLHDTTSDTSFVTAFYLTFRLFTTPVEFAQCLINRFDHIGDSQSVGIPVRLRVYNVFKGWLEGHWVVDSDSSALGVIFSFATGKLRLALPAAGKRLAELTSKATEIRAGALVPRLAVSLGKSGISGSVFVPADSIAPSPIMTRSQLSALKGWKEGKTQCTILDFDPLELARQLTIIESKLFCEIQPEELLALEWTKKAGKSVNVKAMSTLSNDLANLVIDTILHLEDVKRRAVVIKHWIKIASRCLELNNYDSLMAILASLNTSMVARLKKTWELVSIKTKARFDDLKLITDHARNYAVLRQRLQDHVAPCIPFVGMYLTDLTFVDAGNGATRQLPGECGEDGITVINFDKHMKVAKIIGQLQSFQVPYRLTPVPEMQEWMESQIQRMHSNDQVNPQSFHRQSLLLEPRDPPRVVKAGPPPVNSSASSILTTDTRTTSKDRFELLSLYFSSSSVKDR